MTTTQIRELHAPVHQRYSPSAVASIQDRAGLYIAVVALILAALSLGIQVSNKAATDAQIEAAMAKPQAEMHQASTNAMLAKERMDRAVAQLEAKGLLKPETH